MDHAFDLTTNRRGFHKRTVRSTPPVKQYFLASTEVDEEKCEAMERIGGKLQNVEFRELSGQSEGIL